MDVDRQRFAKCQNWRYGWHGPVEAVLRAPCPFNEGDELTACPQCRAVEEMAAGCDEPGCDKEGSCGTPMPDGYRVTCGAHRPKEDTADGRG